MNKSLFTKRQHNFLASVINMERNKTQSKDRETREFILGNFTLRLANALERDNPKFNRTKFLDACTRTLTETEHNQDTSETDINIEAFLIGAG